MKPSELKIGNRVKYYPLKDAPGCKLTTIRSKPWKLGSGTWVVLVKNITGGVAIDHLERIK